jgi:hypothetical protein
VGLSLRPQDGSELMTSPHTEEFISNRLTLTNQIHAISVSQSCNDSEEQGSSPEI